MTQAMKIPDAEAAANKEREKLEKIPAWNLTKVTNITELIAEARTEGKTVQKEEDRIVAKSKPTAMNVTSTVSTSSSSVNHPIASKSPGILNASTGKPDARARRNSKPDAASSSQGRLKGAYLGGLMDRVAGKPTGTDKSQESWEFSESESWSNHEKEVMRTPVAIRNSGTSENSEAGSRKWPHHFHMSPAVVSHMERVSSIVRQIYGRSPTDDLNDLDVNTTVWSFFMNVILQVAVHLGRDYMEKLRYIKNQLLKSVKELFQVTERLIKDQKEISCLTTNNYGQLSWRSTSFLCDKAFEITNAKTFVFADLVLCLGSVRDQLVEAWKNKIIQYFENRDLTDLNRIDGEPVEFEWTRFTTLGILEEIRKMMTELQCELEQFKGRIIFMSMYNDIVWREGNT